MSKAINIILDGPPGQPASGAFNVGEWIEQPDGFWALRITELPKEVSDV
jgi:hypothetical protein